MKGKLFLLGVACLTLSGISSAQTGQVSVGTQNVSVIDFNGNIVSSALEDAFWNSISNIVSSITGGASIPIINQKLSDLLMQFIEGIICPQFNIPSLSEAVKVPTSITIALPCKNVSVNFSQATSQAISNSNVVKVAKSVDETIANCIRHPKQCQNPKVATLIKSQSPLASMKLEGMSSDKQYADKPAEQVNQEVEDTTKIMSVSDVQYLTNKDGGEGARLNQSSQNVRLSKMNDASASYGELPSIGKENFSSKSSNELLKPYYNFVASKQIARREYIYALEELLRRERKKLAQIVAMVKGVCNSRWKVPVIQRQYFGFIGNPYKKFAKVKKVIKQEVSDLKQAVNSLSGCFYNAKQNYLDFKVVNLTSRFLGGDECPCCPCITIQSYVNEAKTEIMARITEAEHLLASVISKEAYAIRQQIDADVRASTEMLKKVECAKAYLEYQRNYLLTLQLELQIAQLKALYSQLNKDELEQYNNIKDAVKEQVQNLSQ